MSEHTGGPKAVAIMTMVAALVSVFVTLGFVAHHAAYGTALDHSVLAWLVNHRSAGLTSLATAVTNVGSPVGVATVASIVAAISWWRLRSPRPAILILMTLAVAGAVSSTSKVIVGAHRPAQAVQLVVETDPSFPSGHVTGTLALLGALAVVIGHHGGRVVFAAALVLAAAATAAVALTRLYLGVHWVTDVVGGFLLGTATVLVAYVSYRRMMGSMNGDGTAGARVPAGPVAAVGV